jgi:cysteine desulfurase/selenocysteine lyase
MPVDVKKIGCDFFTFSGHKMLGPAGTGVLWGKEYLLEMMPPFMSGGGMIQDLTADSFVWEGLPWKFEAGTPDLCGAVALAGADVPGKDDHLTGAVDYLNQIGMNNVRTHTISLCTYAIEKMSGIKDLILYGPAEPEKRCGIISFNIIKDGVLADSHMVNSFFDDEGIALRAGGHCSYPFMREMGVPGTLRMSFYIYNTTDEIDIFINLLKDIIDNRLL